MLQASDESIEELGFRGLKLIQNKAQFCFGTDAVLLCGFTRVARGGRVLDLGCGNGIIPVLLSHKTKASKIVGIEIQHDAAQLAKRNVALNCLEDKIEIIKGDLRSIKNILKAGYFDTVVSNPPYMEPSRGRKNESEALKIARHELMCNVNDVVAAASYALKFGGRFHMIHRPERIADITCAMRNNSLELKRLRLVYPKPGKRPVMMLVEGQKGARAGCIIDEPLYIQDESAKYTPEIMKLYERDVADNG